MREEWRATDVGRGQTDDRRVTVPGTPADFAGTDAVRYETTIDDPREPGDDVAILHLNGLYAHSDVEISGAELLGWEGPVTHDAYFEPLRVPFRPDDSQQTTLRVTCRAPSDRFGGLHDTDRVPPEARVPGIRWDADVETAPLPAVDELRIRPELTDEGATLHVRTTVLTDGPLEDRITYSLKPAGDLQTRGTMDRRTIDVDDPGLTTVEHTIDVHDPALWWPQGFGQQNRYTLEAKLGDTRQSVTTGIAAVRREGGELVVNGTHVPVRGVALTTASPDDVRRAVDLNASVVRAQAQVLPPAVYEACDEAGLLVWQDLPLTGPGAFDVDRGAALASSLTDAYGHHPSLATLGVHDEPTDSFADGLGSGMLDGLRLRWRAWRTEYDRTAADRVADAVAEPWPVVPVTGGPGVDADAAAFYPGWDYGTPATIDSLVDRYDPALVGAFGAGALVEGGSPEAADFDADKHARQVGSDDVPASQAYQASLLGTVAERLRRRGVGAIATTLRDTDDAGMGVYARDGSPKDGAEALAQAFEPVQAFLTDPGSGSSNVIVVNDHPSEVAGELRWAAGEAEGSIEVSVAGGERWTGGPIDLPRDADVAELVLVAGETAIENRYSI